MSFLRWQPGVWGVCGSSATGSQEPNPRVSQKLPGVKGNLAKELFCPLQPARLGLGVTAPLGPLCLPTEPQGGVVQGTCQAAGAAF